jgi:hypothetical protein
MCPGPPTRNTRKYSARANAPSALISGLDSVQPTKPVRPKEPAAKIPPAKAIVAPGAVTPSCRNRALAVAA